MKEEHVTSLTVNCSARTHYISLSLLHMFLSHNYMSLFWQKLTANFSTWKQPSFSYKRRAAWNFLLSSLLPIPNTCLPSSICCCLSTLSFLGTPAFSSWYLFLSLPFASLFSWLLQKSHQISISLSFATWCIQTFLWLLPAGLSWYLSRDLLGLPHPVQPAMP